MYRVVVLACLMLAACGGANDSGDVAPPSRAPSEHAAVEAAPAAAMPPVPAASPAPVEAVAAPRGYRVVHVIVALADNQHQGIVRVPADLGNGQNPRTNLYWGAMYGTKTFFQRSDRWQRVAVRAADRADVLETCVFVHRSADPPVYLVAMAYDGRAMKAALTDYFDIAAGGKPMIVNVDGRDAPITCGSSADLLCFVGHNGLMDLQLDHMPAATGKAHPAAAVVLACRSKPYFAQATERLGCEALVMTTGLMAPEAYTLDALVDAWSHGQDAVAIRRAAAAAYAKYQKCSIAAAERLFDAR